MRRILTLLMFGVLLTGIPVSTYAHEPGEGAISGQVINDTQGGGSVGGTEITLLTYIDDSLADTAITTADDEGKFHFDNINLGYGYLVAARYQDVDYYYPVEFETGEVTVYVEVGVCDTTDSDALIRAGLTHKIMEIEEETLYVTEVHWLVNNGDKTYLRADGVLDFTLPEGAFGFQAPEELVVDFQLLENNTVTYLVPFPPGERQLVYAYSLPKPDEVEFSISLTIDYPTDNLEVMIGGEDIEAAVTQLAPAEPVTSEAGVTYLHFQGENISRNVVIDLQLADLSQSSGFSLFIIIWVIIVVVVVSIAFYLIRKGKKRGADER
jgi:hypothetical protein